VTAALDFELTIEGRLDTSVYDLGNHLGFRAVGDRAEFRFYARGHPLCSDVDSYWFGDHSAWRANRWNQVTQSFYTGSDSGATLAWRNRTVPGRGRLILRTVLTGGVGSQPPTLDLTGTTIPPSINWETPITITGTATDPENSSVTVVAIFDFDATSSGTLAALMPSGSQFKKTFTLESFNAATPGTHRLDVYAVDYSGMFSDARTFTIQVNAQLFTPSVPEERSQSFGRSDPYALSQLFSGSIPHPVSESFIGSDLDALSQLFIISTEYTSSKVFALSHQYAQSHWLMISNRLSPSLVSDDSQSHFEIKFLTDSVRLPESSDFNPSILFTASKNWRISVPLSLSEQFRNPSGTSSRFSISLSSDPSDINETIPIVLSSQTQVPTPGHAGGRDMGNSSVFIAVGIAVPLVFIVILVLIVLKTKDESTEECQESETASEVSDTIEELVFEESSEEEELFLTNYNQDIKLGELSESCEESDIFQGLFPR
jgi:hypothetical protein